MVLDSVSEASGPDERDYNAIVDAAHRLRGKAHTTPVLTARPVNCARNAQLFFKCENFQRTGAIGFRGAYNALCGLSKTQRKHGVLAYSTGNHAVAVACAARMLQIDATVLLPLYTPLATLALVRETGARLVLCDPAKGEFATMAQRLTNQSGLTVIAPSGHPGVIAGLGTVAKELFEEVGPLDYLFVPMVTGGLVAACATVAAQRSTDCVIVGVTQSPASVAMLSGLSSSDPCDSMQEIVQNQFVAHEILAVDEVTLGRQMRFFAEQMKIIVEPVGALAAVAACDYRFDPGARVGVIVSGGNTTMPQFNRMIGANTNEPRGRKPRRGLEILTA